MMPAVKRHHGYASGMLVGVVAVVILFALPLVVIGAFVVLAVTGHALDPSDLICTRAWPLGAGRIWYL